MKKISNILFALGFLLVLCGCDSVRSVDAVVCSPSQWEIVPNWVLECIKHANQMADDPEDTVQQCTKVAPGLLCDKVPGFQHAGEIAPDFRIRPCSEAKTEEERDVCPKGEPTRSP